MIKKHHTIKQILKQAYIKSRLEKSVPASYCFQIWTLGVLSTRDEVRVHIPIVTRFEIRILGVSSPAPRGLHVLVHHHLGYRVVLARLGPVHAAVLIPPVHERRVRVRLRRH